MVGFVCLWGSFSWILFPWIRDVAAEALLNGRSLALGDLQPVPSIIGVGVIGVLLGFGLILRFRRSLSYFSHVPGWSEAQLARVTAVGVAILGLSLLASGEPSIMDSKTHLARGVMWHTHLKQGMFPYWTPLWYGGMPADFHYPPLAHFLQGFVNLVLPSPVLSAKLVAWGAQIMGGVGFALWASRFYSSRTAGFLGGLVFAAAPVLHAAWLWEGRLPGIVLLGVAPWLFYLTERILDGDSRPSDAGAIGIVLWLCVMAHAGQARLVFLLWASYGALRLVLSARESGLAKLGPALMFLGVGTALGGLASFVTVYPIVQEAAGLNDLLSNKISSFQFRIPDVHHLVSLFRWNPRGTYYLGTSILAASLVGVFALRSRELRSRVCIAMVLAILPSFLVSGVRRDLDFFFFGGVLLASVVGIRGVIPSRGLIVLVALLVLDLGPLQWVNTYSAFRGVRNELYAEVEASQGQGRFLEIPASRDGVPFASHWYISPIRDVRTVGGPFIQGAPKSFRFEASMIDTVANALADWNRRTNSTEYAEDSLPRELRNLLEFHNVEELAVVSPLEVFGKRIRLDRASSVYRLDANALLTEGTPRIPPEDVVVSGGLPVHASRTTSSAQLDWLRRAQPERIAGFEYARTVSGEESWNLQEWAGGTMRIQRSPYPGTEVLVNGVPVQWEPGPWGGICIDLPLGPARIRMDTPPVARRRTAFLAQCAVLAILLTLWVWRWRPRFRRPVVNRGL